MLCVRPGVFDAKARRFCCVSVLMQVDLPALERPTKATSGTSSVGRCSSWGAVVRNRAVCSQPCRLLISGRTALSAPSGPCTLGVLEGVVYEAVAVFLT